LIGLTKSTMSHSIIQMELDKLAKHLNLGKLMELKHRLLNTYVHAYQEKLCLINSEMKNNEFTSNGGFSLTVDYGELADLDERATKAGVDPYILFMKSKKE